MGSTDLDVRLPGGAAGWGDVGARAVIRLSVTHLESLRYDRDVFERDGMEDLIADLTRAKPPTAKMEAGKALAAFLEHAAPGGGPIDSIMRDGWCFDFSKLDAQMPAPAITELKARKVIETGSGQVLLTGKADGVSGLFLNDEKLVDRFDAEKYFESLQWRAYLWMLQARSFTYNVFVGKIDEEEKRVQVYELHPVTFYTYPDIDLDVCAAVDDLAGIIRRGRETSQALREAFPELPDELEEMRERPARSGR
jgi:hypothetical protein